MLVMFAKLQAFLILLFFLSSHGSLCLFLCSGLPVRLLCQLCFKHLLWEQRSVAWKSPTEAFKGYGSQAKSNIWVWNGGEVHRRNLFIPPPQMRIFCSCQNASQGFGEWVQQVTGWDTYTKAADYNIPPLGQAAHHWCHGGKYHWTLSPRSGILSVPNSSLCLRTSLYFLFVLERTRKKDHYFYIIFYTVTWVVSCRRHYISQIAHFLWVQGINSL